MSQHQSCQAEFQPFTASCKDVPSIPHKIAHHSTSLQVCSNTVSEVPTKLKLLVKKSFLPTNAAKFLGGSEMTMITRRRWRSLPQIHLNFPSLPSHIQGGEVPWYWTNFDMGGRPRNQILLQTSQSHQSQICDVSITQLYFANAELQGLGV